MNKEDELIQRAANPRTGIVSPYVISEDSCRGNVEDDYVAAGRMRAARDNQNSNISSARWQQDSEGWNIVESSVVGLATQRAIDNLGQRIPLQSLQDQARSSGVHEMKRIDTLPNPQHWARERLIIPPMELENIQRKHVGSGAKPKHVPNDTMTVNSKAGTASLTQSAHHGRETGKARTVTPGKIALATLDEDRLCLDLSSRDPCPASRIACVAHSPQLQEKSPQSSQTRQSPRDAASDHLRASPILSQYIPSLRLLHPSQFANLEKSSYRCPTHLMRTRLKPGEAKWKAVENACTLSTATLPSAVYSHHQMPTLQMQDEKDNVRGKKAQRTTDKAQGQDVGWGNRIPDTGRTCRDHPANVAQVRIESIHPINQCPSQPSLIMDIRDMGRIKHGASAAMLVGSQSRKLGNVMHLHGGLNAANAKIVRKPVPGSQGTDVHIPTCNHGDNRNDFKLRATSSPVKATLKEQEHPIELPGYTNEDIYFADQWPEENNALQYSDGPQQLESIRTQSLLQRAAKETLWLQCLESWLQTSMSLAFFYRKAWDVVHHMMSTMRLAPAAIGVLREPGVTPHKYLTALKDLTLAGMYLLVLWNLSITMINLLLVILEVVHGIYHTFKVLFMVLRWCILW